MRISVVNLTFGLLSDTEVITAIRAINRQIAEDFAPYWNNFGVLRLEGNSSDEPDSDNPEDMQGEGIIYLWDKSDVPNALGYHDINYRGIPYGFVFVDIATEIGENWTVTLSHEALELLGDRQANTLVKGPDPRDRRRNVYHWHEMCDAVQDEHYEIDGVQVSNFVLPLYFTPDSEPGSRNDFLGTQYRKSGSRDVESLKSFGINPGGYVGFFDPASQKHLTESAPDLDDSRQEIVDENVKKRAETRQKRKNKARMARRGNRYMEMGEPPIETVEKVAPRRKTRVKIDKQKITVRCKTDELAISTGIKSLRGELRQGCGYFAHDIYADAQTVDKELMASDLEEIGAVEIDAVKKADSEPMPVAEFEVGYEPGESIVALVDVDGILFWQESKKSRKGIARFDIKVQTVAPNKRSRRGFLLKGAKTVVRFIKHTLTGEGRKLIKENLDKFLVETIEKAAFRKKVSSRLHHLKLLPNERNKTVGTIKKLTGRLQPNKKYLVLIHGIFSSTKGAFGELLLNRWNDEILSNLYKGGKYDKIISFDHWTVARSTLENATDLFAALPDKCHIDIVCHSRGAGVSRCLLEHPDLAGKLSRRNIGVGKVIFVGGACQGSPLASSNRVNSLVNVFSALSSLSGSYLPLKLFTGLIKAVQYGVKSFPGIESMAPGSPIFKELKKPINQRDCEYIYVRSNYEPRGKLATMLDQIGLDEFVFRGKPNDVVVPFAGAGKFDAHVTETIKVTAGPQYGVGRDEHVFHTQFFEQREVRKALIAHLASR